MKFKLFLFLVLFFACSFSARADWFHTLVGFNCNQNSDSIEITYDGAYNEEGEALIKNKTKNQWSPWSLITSMKDDDHIGSLKTIKKNCKLSDGNYEISIFPGPGNMNIQGRCGAAITAGAEVKKQNKRIFYSSGFEADCHDIDSSIITKVLIRAKDKAPTLTSVKYNDFYR